jgi:hypothetical protein
VVEPAELLEHLGMGRVRLYDALIGITGTKMILLLFENMADLEPDVGVCERTRWIPQNAVKAPKGLVELALLFVDYPQTEENLVLLVKI